MNPEKNKIKAILDEKKRAARENAKEFTYGKIAEKMNLQFEQAGIKQKISEQQVKYLINGQTELDVPKGLALATVLGCAFVDFLPDEVMELASFETELFFDSPTDVNQYFSEYDKTGRILICSQFPTYMYLSPLERFRECSSTEQQIHKKRIQQLKGTQSSTTEYYEIQALLNFIFSPFYSIFTKEQKLLIIDNYINMFAPKSRKNGLYFFSANMQYRQFSSYHLNPSKSTITMTTPLGRNYFLQIKNKAFYNKISNFIESNNDIHLLNIEESVALIQRIKQVLLTHEKLDYQAIINFYHASDTKLQSMIHDNVKHLLDK